MKVASGNVSDRPFARTVFSLASKRFTGDLVMQHKRRETKVVWSEGQVVAAQSASPADSVGRQALTHGLVNSSTLGVFVQKMSAAPEKDPTAVLAELANLSHEQCVTLKHHVLVRSASRMFALPDATFVVDNEPSIVADPDLPSLDVRWLIYFGLRTHYSLERLTAELSVLGSRTVLLSPEFEPMVAAFGFAEYEGHVLERLRGRPITLPELLASGLDANIVNCVVYALVACSYLKYGAVEGRPASSIAPPAAGVPAPAQAPPGAGAKQAMPQGRSHKRAESIVQETVQGVGFVSAAKTASASSARPAAPARAAAPAAVPSPVAAPVRAAAAAPAAAPSSAATPAQGKPRSKRAAPKDTSADAETTVALVKDKHRMFEDGANHYQMLGLEEAAVDSAVRQSYFQLARRLHPDRLQALGVEGLTPEIQTVFAAINDAFKTLSNPKELAQYRKVLAAGGKAAYEAEQAKAGELAGAIFEAEEHYHLGEMALRRDQFSTAESSFKKACELRPEESEYQALYAWAMYCNAPDRAAVEGDAMGKISSALLKSPKSVPTRLYHAKLLKLMGRDEEAIASFKKLMQMDPDHREGMLELRVLKNQALEATKSKKGFFGR